MANATYDNLWQQAVAELGEQLNVEGADEEGEEENGDKDDVRPFSTALQIS